MLVSVVLNLVSAYLKNPLDRTLGKLSSHWAKRSVVKRERAKAIALRNSKNQHEELIFAHRCTIRILLGIFFILFGLAMLHLINMFTIGGSHQSHLVMWFVAGAKLFISALTIGFGLRLTFDGLADFEIVLRPLRHLEIETSSLPKAQSSVSLPDQ